MCLETIPKGTKTLLAELPYNYHTHHTLKSVTRYLKWLAVFNRIFIFTFEANDKCAE